jgi:hypothetical protein
MSYRLKNHVLVFSCEQFEFLFETFILTSSDFRQIMLINSQQEIGLSAVFTNLSLNTYAEVSDVANFLSVYQFCFEFPVLKSV